MLLGRHAGDRRPGLHRVVGGAAVRQPAGLQALRQELPRHRGGRRRGHAPRGPGHLGASGQQQHGEAGRAGRGEPRHQLQHGGRGPQAVELQVGDDAARVTRGRRDGGGGVVRGGRAAREHQRRHV